MDDDVTSLCEAIQIWHPDMDEVDVVCSAEAYFVESRFTGICPWELLTCDILEIEGRCRRIQPFERPEEDHLPAEPQDAKVISMERWRQERGR
jgi:hypothetical protein